MKLGPVTKLDKRNTVGPKKANCDIIVIFQIYDQFGAIQKPDPGFHVCDTYIFINSNLVSYKY